MLERATIDRAYFLRTDKLTGGPGVSLIGRFLASSVGERSCLVLITRPDGKFTLVLDPEWTELAMTQSTGSVDIGEQLDIDLPRSALRAVVEGWPDEWERFRDPALELHLSDDEVPHLWLTEAGVPASPRTDWPL